MSQAIEYHGFPVTPGWEECRGHGLSKGCTKEASRFFQYKVSSIVRGFCAHCVQIPGIFGLNGKDEAYKIGDPTLEELSVEEVIVMEIMDR